MKTNLLISLLVFGILALVIVLPIAEARSFSNFRWDIDETYHRDGHVQFVVQKGTDNFLPVGIRGLDNVTVTLHPTINHDQTGEAKLPRDVDIYFEPDIVTLTDGEEQTVKLVINVGENAPASLYDVQIVGTWKEEDKIPDFMGSSIRLHVGHDFGDGKIPVNMLDPPLKFWKLIENNGGTVNDVPCRNDYVLVVKHDDSPACVTESTKQKLIERGWTNYDDIGNMLSSKYVGISDVEKLLVKNKIDYLPDKLIIAGGLSIMGDSGCGAVIDIDSQTHWFVIDSISDPKKITFLQETPQMCKVNTSSCYCHVHKELTALTLNELSYFTSAEQEKYSEILIEYLYDQNINRTPKFQIGKLNLNYTDAAAIGYCGHIWGTNTYGFFSGAVVNDVVEDYRIDKELPLLCAISDDAKWWENEN